MDPNCPSLRPLACVLLWNILLLLALGRSFVYLIGLLCFQELLSINILLDPLDELDQGFRSVPIERRDTLGVLNP